MIYFTTFIFTLLLSHIARASPACGDAASPEELYDPTYSDAQADQHPFPMTVYNVTWTTWYDNKNGDTKKTACPDLAKRYPHFKNFPDYPYIGGAFNIKRGTQKNCGECWKLTHVKTHKWIYITAMDSAKSGFNISEIAFNELNSGLLGAKSLQAEATPVNPRFCAIRK